MMDRELAIKAHRASQKEGIDGKALAKAVGVSSAKEAWQLAAVGGSWAAIEKRGLTDAERLLLIKLAEEERRLLAQGTTSSAKGVDVSWRARKSGGWAAATAAKRLGTHRKGEDERCRGSGLNFVEARRNGHMWLTPAGWAVVKAMEAR